MRNPSEDQACLVGVFYSNPSDEHATDPEHDLVAYINHQTAQGTSPPPPTAANRRQVSLRS